MKNALYVHIPFCQKKCFYCAFIVSVGKPHWVDEYLNALVSEVNQCSPQQVDTVYIGGGSPSFLNDGQIANLFHALSSRFDFTNVSEMTFEMNPEDVSESRLRTLRAVGVNRISLGVQSFSDDRLSFLGRCHNSSRALEAYRLLRSEGFKNVNIDVMYGFPGQGERELFEELNTVIELLPEHVSVYTLTLESPSKFAVFPPDLPDSQELVKLFCSVKTKLEAAGYRHYEVSNFAWPGFESRHNLNYWQAGDYLGLGVGAHSHQQGRRWWNIDQTKRYIERVTRGASASDGEEFLSTERRLREALVFGLRMVEGVSLPELEKKFGGSFEEETQDQIEQCAQQGLIDFDRQACRVRMTLKGLLVLDEVSVRLI